MLFLITLSKRFVSLFVLLHCLTCCLFANLSEEKSKFIPLIQSSWNGIGAIVGYSTSYRVDVFPTDEFIYQMINMGIVDSQKDHALIKSMNTYSYRFDLSIIGELYKYTRIPLAGTPGSLKYRNARVENFDGFSYGVYEAHYDDVNEKFIDGLAGIRKVPAERLPLLNEILFRIPFKSPDEPNNWIEVDKLLAGDQEIGADLLDFKDLGKEIHLEIGMDKLDSKYLKKGFQRGVKVVFSKETFRLIRAESFFYSLGNRINNYKKSQSQLITTFDYSGQDRSQGATHLLPTSISVQEYVVINEDKPRSPEMYDFELLRTLRYQIVDLNLNASTSGESIAINLPLGTKILDEFTNSHFIVGGAEENLKSLAREIGHEDL